MSTKFSAHPDLAVEQLQRAELTARQNSNKSHTHHRRHHSAGAGTTSGSNTPTKSAKNVAKQLNSNGALTGATAADQTNLGGAARAEQQKAHFDGAFPRLTPARTYNTTASSHTQQHVDALDNKFAYNTDVVDVNTMVLAYIDDIDLNCDDEDDDVYIRNANSRSSNTKDCTDCTPSTTLRWSAAAATTQEQPEHAMSADEPDYLQHRFSRTADNCNSRHPQLQRNCVDYYTADPRASPIHAISDGCGSGVSSALSSPSASTVSSPLSTPTRLAPHFQQNQNQPNNSNCCQKSLASGCCCGGDAGGGGYTSDSDKGCKHQHHHSQHLQLHHHHHHHHQHQHQHQHTMTSSTSLKSTSKAAAAAAAAAVAASSSSSSSGCKKSQKYDPRLLGPSRYRQLLPVVLCILSFAIVFSILIVYMDTTEIRHKQFRLNMSRDYEFFGVAQDDPTLIAFLREIHMRKYPMHFLKNAPIDDATASPAVVAAAAAAATAAAGAASLTATAGGAATTHFNFSNHYEGLSAEMAHYVADLVGGKENGAFIQSLPGAMGHLMTAPWLAATLNWAGLVVEPEPRRFFTLRKQNAQRPGLQVVHACISPNPYPKEVTIHNEESEVRINSLLDEETSWFNSRVKCFPLYSLMLACNRVTYDLLSLGVHGHELEILQTLPFDRVQIEVISIHLSEDIARGYVNELTKFLADKSYKLQKTFGRNYFYQRIKTTSRTRKKDILLLKTP